MTPEELMRKSIELAEDNVVNGAVYCKVTKGDRDFKLSLD